MLPYFPHPKSLLHIVRNKTKNNHDNLLENKKVIQSQKMSKKCPKNSKFLVSKYIKMLEFLKTLKTFLNKGTKHEKKLYERSKLKK